jgi:hypothetical protein
MPDTILQNEATAVMRETTVILTDAGGNPLSGLDASKVTIKIAKAGGNFVASTATLTEVTGGAVTDGEYRLRFASGEVDTAGDLAVEISSGTSTITTLTGYVPITPACRSVDLADGFFTAAKFAADAITSTVIATDAIDAAAIKADAVTKIQSGLATDASMQLVLGLHRRNSLLDGGSGQATVIYNGNHLMTTARLRVFASSVALAAATPGAADNADGEIQRYTITGTDTGSGLVATFKLAQVL